MSALSSRADCEARAYAVLEAEVLDALQSDSPGGQLVSTPAWGRSSAALSDVISDRFAGDDAALDELLAIVAAHSRSGCKRSQDWMRARAREHADFHAGDLASEMIEDEGADPDAWGDERREEGASA